MVVGGVARIGARAAPAVEALEAEKRREVSERARVPFKLGRVGLCVGRVAEQCASVFASPGKAAALELVHGAAGCPDVANDGAETRARARARE